MNRLFALTLALAGLTVLTLNPAFAQSSSPDKEEKTAEVTLTEFSDYQCPACGYYQPWVNKLKKDFGDELKVVHRHYPLRQHRFAALAARAAEAARNQGKFWEMHNMIFNSQDRWSRGGASQTFLQFAQELNLDMEQFKKDLNSKEIYERVQDDKRLGVEKGVNSTPTFFVNGDKLQPPRSYDAFKSAIQQALQQSKSK